MFRNRRLMAVTSNPMIGTNSNVTRVRRMLIDTMTPSRKTISMTSRIAVTTELVAALATCSLL